jgi:hypothetical protein
LGWCGGAWKQPLKVLDNLPGPLRSGYTDSTSVGSRSASTGRSLGSRMTTVVPPPVTLPRPRPTNSAAVRVSDVPSEKNPENRTRWGPNLSSQKQPHGPCKQKISFLWIELPIYLMLSNSTVVVGHVQSHF